MTYHATHCNAQARKQRDTTSSGATTLFIARLPAELSEDDLYAAFERYHPRKCHFVNHKDSGAFAYGFVVFATPQDCKSAFESTKEPGFTIGDAKVVVEYALS